MKVLLLVLTLTLSFSIFADEMSDKIDLRVLQTTLEATYETVTSLEETIADLARESEDIGAFEFVKRSRNKKMSCGNIKATLATSLLMIAVTFEQIGDIGIDEHDKSALSLKSSLEKFLASSKAAIDECSFPSKAINDVTSAKDALNSAIESVNELQ